MTTIKLTHSKIQRAVKKYADVHKLPMHHSPNEGKRSPIQGHQLKLQGMLPGFPDCHFIRANDRYHGLYIEIKVPPDRLSDNQIKVKAMLESEGNYVAVCRTIDEAISVINAFYGL